MSESMQGADASSYTVAEIQADVQKIQAVVCMHTHTNEQTTVCLWLRPQHNKVPPGVPKAYNI